MLRMGSPLQKTRQDTPTARLPCTAESEIAVNCANLEPYDAPMGWLTSMSTRARNVRAGRRVGWAAALGMVVGAVTSQFTQWQAAILIGWDAAALVLVARIWLAVAPLDAAETKTHAVREDTSIRLSELIILTSGVALLLAVGLVLVRAGQTTGGTKAFLIVLGVASVALTWGLVHTVFALRYARTYYRRPVGGIDFNENDPPTYIDFAYLALTVGMTYQVSDTNLTTKAIRRVALAHALLSFVYGAVIIALVINVVSSLLH
jgi:uncharacterized membrane protein